VTTLPETFVELDARDSALATNNASAPTFAKTKTNVSNPLATLTKTELDANSHETLSATTETLAQPILATLNLDVSLLQLFAMMPRNVLLTLAIPQSDVSSLM